MGWEAGGGSGEMGKLGPLTGGEKHDAGREGPGEAGEGGLLSEGQDAHDDARGGTQGGQDHEGPGGIPISCGSTDRSLPRLPQPRRPTSLSLTQLLPHLCSPSLYLQAPNHLPQPSSQIPSGKHPFTPQVSSSPPAPGCGSWGCGSWLVPPSSPIAP